MEYTRVRSTDEVPEGFEVIARMHQGSVLSPIIFNIIIIAKTEEAREDVSWRISYADVIVFSAERREDREMNLEWWRGAPQDRGMRISRIKTKYMRSPNEGDCRESNSLGGEEINRVEKFQYLRSTISVGGSIEGKVKDYTERLEQLESCIWSTL
ncbi:uncharacterized protein [Palaemon carinicauda]|uniref:uncharacterized protein n=1 Tax=Palaemon carinicauda TaxID=392227 RepID=UPI0035B57156